MFFKNSGSAGHFEQTACVLNIGIADNFCEDILLEKDGECIWLMHVSGRTFAQLEFHHMMASGRD